MKLQTREEALKVIHQNSIIDIDNTIKGLIQQIIYGYGKVEYNVYPDQTDYYGYKPFGTNKNNEPIIIAKLKELGYFVTIEPKEEDFTVWKQDAEGRNYSKVIRLIGNKYKFSVHE